MAESGAGREDFEKLFEQADPWHYGSPYEREKYRRQLELLPPGRVGRALELGCAEGHFTAMLAGRVSHLIAADISPTALGRAEARCGDLENVEFLALDIATDELPGRFDLIFCSEVLYYLAGVAALRRAAAALAGALAPGGVIITGNAYLLHDNKTRTGFDWETRFGGEVIHRCFSETPGLVLEESIDTELYRIDRFGRRDDRRGAAPRVTYLPVTDELEAEMARHIVWGGAVHTRRELAARRTDLVPVLAYRAISEDASVPGSVAPALFRAQLRWLRAQGFHSITAAEVGRHLRAGEAFFGRPVMLMVEDGLQDSSGPAQNLLQMYDFSAESSSWNGTSTGHTIAFGSREGAVELGMPLANLPCIKVQRSFQIESLKDFVCRFWF